MKELSKDCVMYTIYRYDCTIVTFYKLIEIIDKKKRNSLRLVEIENGYNSTSKYNSFGTTYPIDNKKNDEIYIGSIRTKNGEDEYFLKNGEFKDDLYIYKGIPLRYNNGYYE